MSESTQQQRLLSPEEIAVRAGESQPFLRLPESTVFGERAMRLRQLAARQDALRDYLLFIASVAELQHEQLKQAVALQLPDAAQIEAAAHAGRPPLPAALWPREALWRDELRALLGRLALRLGPGTAQDVAQALRAASDEHLETQAERLLGGVMLGLDLGTAPLIAAGLQLHWMRLVRQTQAAHAGARIAPFGRTDAATLCPCCGSRPVASVTRLGTDGGRLLHCGLCAAEWHYVRIKCAHCESTKGIHYENLQAAGDAQPGSAQAVQAECCDECGRYLKIVHMEKDHQVEPLADDLASLTLDLLVSDAGFERAGVNLMLLFGDPDAPPDPGGR
ncbi:formate dehydrogenase accessory protein FdhE [Pelomonas sp. KK5]|uniref:formate dehydrogenase accessory protein FdhE n=1 Tax=Pelomonas sp. KK5 TaxID=1855730 RepID=UPI00097C6438|nr:formate dehydrogenase accessory protein FdhE [Pelomonas sp. KK5]